MAQYVSLYIQLGFPLPSVIWCPLNLYARTPRLSEKSSCSLRNKFLRNKKIKWTLLRHTGKKIASSVTKMSINALWTSEGWRCVKKATITGRHPGIGGKLAVGHLSSSLRQSQRTASNEVKNTSTAYVTVIPDQIHSSIDNQLCSQ